MKTLFSVPTLSQYELLGKLMRSLEKSSLQPDRVLIIDNGGSLKTAAAVRGGVPIPANGSVRRPACNLGCAASWNEALKLGADYTIVCNDDVELEIDTLSTLVAYADEHPEAMLLYPVNKFSGPWSLFLQRRELAERIGSYDDQFYPAYFEDSDYKRRMLLAGHEPVAVPGPGYKHVVSATVKAYDGTQMVDHHQLFYGNRLYYIEKWGGLPGEETLTEPVVTTNKIALRFRG